MKSKPTTLIIGQTPGGTFNALRTAFALTTAATTVAVIGGTGGAAASASGGTTTHHDEPRSQVMVFPRGFGSPAEIEGQVRAMLLAHRQINGETTAFIQALATEQALIDGFVVGGGGQGSVPSNTVRSPGGGDNTHVPTESSRMNIPPSITNELLPELRALGVSRVLATGDRECPNLWIEHPSVRAQRRAIVRALSAFVEQHEDLLFTFDIVARGTRDSEIERGPVAVLL